MTNENRLLFLFFCGIINKTKKGGESVVYLTYAEIENKDADAIASCLNGEIFGKSYVDAILARKSTSSVKESLSSLLLLQKTLSLAGIDTRGLKIQRKENGRPCFEGHETLDFSISHSENAVAVALSTNGKVGVDVERVGAIKDTKRLAARFFSESENKRLEKSEKYENECIEIWTRKEAYIKYSEIKAERIADVDTENAQDVRFYSENVDVKSNAYVLTLCVSKSGNANDVRAIKL